MPEETKETSPVSPEPDSPAGAPVASGEGAGSGAKASAETSPSSAAPTVPPPSVPAAKAEAPSVGKPAEPVKPAAAAATTAAKPVEAAKPAAAPATGEKPVAPAAAKPAAPPATKPAPKPEGPKPEPWEAELVTRLRSQYGSGIKEASTYVGQKYLIVDSSIVYEILLRMRQDELFDYCVDITAVHYPKREAQFDIVYILYSFHHNQRVRVKTQIKDGEHLRTAVEIWETANWLEREVFDMFGIEFDGHPDLKRILLPDGWKGYPLRKDYPILQQDQEWVHINLGIESGQ
ncbi:MAG: NADH-quinone oxidoreductase subunit C [Terriglobales bacterium]